MSRAETVVDTLQARSDLVGRSVLALPGIKWLGLGAAFICLTLFIWLDLIDPEAMPQRLWGRYVAHLDRTLRVLFIWTPGSRIATAQLIGIFAVLAAALVVGLKWWPYMVVAIAVLPPVAIEHRRRKRLLALEEQLDGFLLAIANALKATPSVGDAFMSVQGLIAAPLQQEVELAVKGMRLGHTLMQAIQMMAKRIGSARVDSGLSAILIGREVGGNLPKILETTAATLREIARLESVVRSKTAEGKAQIFVLALFPGLMVYGLNAAKPGYFDPLMQSAIGYLVITIAVLFWIGSLMLARKILSVEV